jgi:hypothetical protein
LSGGAWARVSRAPCGATSVLTMTGFAADSKIVVNSESSPSRGRSGASMRPVRSAKSSCPKKLANRPSSSRGHATPSGRSGAPPRRVAPNGARSASPSGRIRKHGTVLPRISSSAGPKPSRAMAACSAALCDANDMSCCLARSGRGEKNNPGKDTAPCAARRCG